MSQNVNQSTFEPITYAPVLGLPGNEEYICTDNDSSTLSFDPVEGATGYRIYRTSDIELLRKLLAVDRKSRKAFNKRKKQRRARTGRR